MTSATDAELNSLAADKVKFQGTNIDPISDFNEAGNQTIDGETWTIRYKEIRDAAYTAAMSKIPLILNLFLILPILTSLFTYGGKLDLAYKVMLLQFLLTKVDCEVPIIIQQPSITPNNANEGTNSQLRVTTSPSFWSKLYMAN